VPASCTSKPSTRSAVDAATVSWGYTEGRTFSERIEMQGTRDPAAWLAVPDAIRFQAERDWPSITERCRRLTREARVELCELLGTEPLAPDAMLAQMATVRRERLRSGSLRQALLARSRRDSAGRRRG
jgi:isopenicillin-N epimerase